MKHLIIGTAGHVDHGKTALIKALTNIDCDTHKEEKERGITINLGFAHLDLPSGESVGIVDVPGHKDFIKTMVAGSYGIDMVLLVVAADSGIMPQTEEHLRIIEMLDVKHAVIVINKADLVDKETLELATLEIAEFLEGTAIEKAPVVPVSSITGEGIATLKETIAEVVSQISPKPVSGRFRMYIDRIFNVKGMGFVVTGSVLEGETAIGKELFLLPGKSRRIKIRNIERHGIPVSEVFAGDRAALNLAGLNAGDFTRGMVLSSMVIDETAMIDATITLFGKSPGLKMWSDVVFYSGTFETSARLHLIDKDNLKAGEKAIVQIRFSKQAVLVTKDKFIIRNSSNTHTLGGGTILDTKPLHHRKRTDQLIRELTDLSDAILHSDNIINLVKIELNKSNAPMYADLVATKLNRSPNEVKEACLDESQKGVMAFSSAEGVVLVSSGMDRFYYDAILDEITRWHQANPILDDGLEKGYFLGKFGFGKNEAGKQYLDLLIQRLLTEGKIRRTGSSYALAGHVVNVDARTEDQLNWLEKTIQNVGLEKPVPAEIEALAQLRKINKERLKMLLKYLGKQGKLVFCESEYIHCSVVDSCRSKLLAQIAGKEDGINEKEFRELIDGTRKLVQMLLGIFVQEGSVEKRSFYILITEEGKRRYSKELSG